ncbi:glutathione S-transferase family protein [Brevundimonas sp. UBA2416]|nr:glutathione binding-like protein [Brevundimonas sp. UBA2416]
MTSELTFFYTPTSCSLASHIALEEAGAVFDPHRVRLHTPEGVDDYRRINPGGTVPALSIGGVIIPENVAILTWVARAFPDAKLMPDDPVESARVMALIAWFASTVHITRRMARAPFRMTPDETTHPSLSREGRTRFLVNLQKIDGLLEGREWLVGDRMSIADAYALVFYAWGHADEHPVVDLVNYSEHVRRLIARPAVQRAMAREKTILPVA